MAEPPSAPPYLLSGPGVKALFVGAGTHHTQALISDVPSALTSMTELAEALITQAGLGQENITLLPDPESPAQLAEAISHLASEATDIAVFSFVGHGLLGPDGDLYLATQASRDLGRGSARYQALPFSELRELLSATSAGLSLVILDCCWAGRAAAWTGSYVLAATGKDEAAWAPPGDAVTAYTSALIHVMRSGDPSGPALLSLDDVHEATRRLLRERGLPEPRRQAFETSLTSPLLANAAYQAPDDLAAPSIAAGGRSPYRGLRSYSSDDAALFFGRDGLTETLAGRVRHTDAGLIVVTGPSGSGKTSLLQAGLIPALGASRCSMAFPKDQLPPTLASGHVLIVDPLEEIFTDGRGVDAQQQFVAQLLDLAQTANVVVGVRADFFGHCAAFPSLAGPLGSAVVVSPLDDAQVRDVIEGPARVAGLALEEGLVEHLLEEISATSRASVLPLLSHALLTTWQRRRNAVLTLAGYRATGGITAALARTADSTMGALPSAAQDQAKRLLVRLVHVGEGTADTRQSRTREELLPPETSSDHGDAVAALEAFTQARLLTIDGDRVGIVHEALIRAWPLLTSLIDMGRAELLQLQEVAKDANRWDANSRQSGYLYSAPQLEAVRGLRTRDDLAGTVLDFLQASSGSVKTRARRRRMVATAMSVLLVLSLVGAGIATVAFRQAQQQSLIAQSGQFAATSELVGSANPARSVALAVAAYRLAPTDASRQALLQAVSRPARGVLTGHLGPVLSLAVSPDGKTFASGGYDRTIRLWDARTWTEIGRLLGHDGEVGALAYSRDGTLVSGGNDGTIRFWNSGRETKRLTGHASEVSSLSFSADGRTFASGGYDGTVRVWRMSESREVKTLSCIEHGVVLSVAFSLDGRFLACGRPDGSIRLWDAVTHADRGSLSGHTGQLSTLAFSADGRFLASGGADFTVRVWDMERRKSVATLRGHTGLIGAVRFNSDGTALATSAHDGSIRIWDTESWELIGLPLEGPTGGVPSLAWLPGGPTLISGGGGGSDSTIRVWDTGARHQAATALDAPSGYGGSVTLSPDGKLLGICDIVNAIQLWDIAKDVAAQPAVANGGCNHLLAFSADGRALVGLGKDMSTWSVRPLKPIARRSSAVEYPTKFAFNARSHLIAMVQPINADNSSAIHVWDTSTWTPVGKPLSVDEPVASLAFNADGSSLATGTDNGSIIVWEQKFTRKRTFRRVQTRVSALAFHPGGKLLASSGDFTLHLWNLPSGTEKITPQFTGNNQIQSLAFSPDGRLLAGGGLSGTRDTPGGVLLWESQTGRQLGAPLIAGGASVINALFTPAGDRVIAVPLQGKIRIWAIHIPSEAELVEAACGAVGPHLARREQPDSDLACPIS